MSDNKNYITPQGLARLKAEFTALIHGERPKLVETVAWAAGNGDRSENADYIYGKRRLREIDKRLGFLSKRIESAFPVDPASLKSSTVIFGATITISNSDEVRFVYQIVGEDEANASQGKISWRSPLAKAFLGKKQDDEVLVQKPAGEEYYVLEKIEFK